MNIVRFYSPIFLFIRDIVIIIIKMDDSIDISMPASDTENAPTTTIISQPIPPPPPPLSTTTTLEPTDCIGSPPRKKVRRGIDDSKRRALWRY
jgi:hypothetical protein